MILASFVANVFTEETTNTLKDFALLGGVISTAIGVIVIPAGRWFNRKFTGALNPLTVQLVDLKTEVLDLKQTLEATQSKLLEHDVKLSILVEAIAQVLPNHGTTMNDKITQILKLVSSK